MARPHEQHCSKKHIEVKQQIVQLISFECFFKGKLIFNDVNAIYPRDVSNLDTKAQCENTMIVNTI